MPHYRSEILTIFCSYFGRNDDFINSFWNLLTFTSRKHWTADLKILILKRSSFIYKFSQIKNVVPTTNSTYENTRELMPKWNKKVKKKEIEACFCFCSYFNFLTLLQIFRKKSLFHFGALKAHCYSIRSNLQKNGPSPVLPSSLSRDS